MSFVSTSPAMAMMAAPSFRASGGSAYRDRIAAQTGIGDRGEHAGDLSFVGSYKKGFQTI
jgi:hypothetical protein